MNVEEGLYSDFLDIALHLVAAPIGWILEHFAFTVVSPDAAFQVSELPFNVAGHLVAKSALSPDILDNLQQHHLDLSEKFCLIALRSIVFVEADAKHLEPKGGQGISDVLESVVEVGFKGKVVQHYAL